MTRRPDAPWPPNPVQGQAPVFRGLSAAAQADVLAHARRRQVGRRELLARQGEPADRFYVVESGTLKLTQVTADGREVLVRFVGPWQPFGAVAALEGGHYPVTAQAVEPTRVYEWPRPVITELAARYPALRANLMQALADHMTDALARVRELATERVPQRLARALVRLAQQRGRQAEGGWLIEHPLTRQDLADLAGTTLYTASRILARWTAAEIVATVRGRLLIRQPEKLARLAAGDEASLRG